MSNETKDAAAAASGARVRLGEIKAEQIAFLPDTVTIRGAVYYRIIWTYAGEGDNLVRVGWGWVRSCAVPRWATPGCGSARCGAFVLGDARRRSAANTRHGWDLLIDSVTEESAKGRAE